MAASTAEGSLAQTTTSRRPRSSAMLVRARGWGAIRIRTGIAGDRGSAPAKPTGQSSGPVISIPVLPATGRSWAAIVLPASGKGDQPVDQRRPGGGGFRRLWRSSHRTSPLDRPCLLYTSDAADE